MFWKILYKLYGFKYQPIGGGADNVAVTAGSGTTVATEDEGGVHYQKVKLTASGSGTTEALSKAEDSAHSSGDHGITALTVRQDTAAALSGTDADYQPLITDGNGRLHTLDANSAAIKTAVETLDNAISGSEMQVDVVGSLPAGTNLIGYVGHGKTIKTVTGTVSADTDIVAAVASKRIKVIAYSLISASTTSNTITMQSNASTALWTVPLQAPTGTVAGANLSIPAPSFLFATVAGEKLTLDVSAAQNITYSVTYFDDDAT